MTATASISTRAPSGSAATPTVARADAVLAASVFHDGVYSIAQVKAAMDQAGVPVRQ